MGSPYLFLNGPTGLTYDSTLANYLVKTKGYKKIAMLTNNDSYGAGEESAFTSSLKSLGLTPVAAKVVPADQTNMTPELQSIKSSDPQVLFIGAEEAQSGLTVKQARALGMTAVIAEGAPAGTPLYMSTAGMSDANGTIVSSPYLGNSASSAAETFAAAYTSAYGSAPELHGAKAYDGAAGHDRRAQGLPRLHRPEPRQRDPRGALQRAARRLRLRQQRRRHLRDGDRRHHRREDQARRLTGRSQETTKQCSPSSRRSSAA